VRSHDLKVRDVGSSSEDIVWSKYRILLVGSDDSSTMWLMLLPLVGSYILSYISGLRAAQRLHHPSASVRDDVGQDLIHCHPRLTLRHSATRSWQRCALSYCRSNDGIGHDAYGAT
jgi:hypothetical protein